MKKYLFILVIIPFLYGCPPHLIEPPMPLAYNRPMADSIYTLVPYKDSTVNKFIHNNGYVVAFKTSRTDLGRLLDDSLKYQHTYYDRTELLSDYPNIKIRLDFDWYGTNSSSFNIYVNGDAFYTNNFIKSVFSSIKNDSTLVSGKYYKNVFVFKNYHDYSYSNYIKFADSLYYNTTHGILKIFLTNGESYSIYN